MYLRANIFVISVIKIEFPKAQKDKLQSNSFELPWLSKSTRVSNFKFLTKFGFKKMIWIR